MSRFEKTAEFPVPSHRLWEIIGNVSRIDWVPTITKCSFDGKIRTMTMLGVGEIQEEIFLCDQESMLLEYGVVNNTFVKTHQATMRIIPQLGRCTLVWTVVIEPDSLSTLIEDGVQTALDTLSEMLTA